MEKVESVFRNKNYVLTFFGHLVTQVGSLFYSFAISFYILSITNNNAAIQGTYLAVGGIVFLVFSIFSGVICDRFNKAKVMYVCDLLRGVLILLSVVFIYLLKNNVTGQLITLFTMNCLSNAINSIFSPASSALLSAILKDEQMQQGESYLSVISSFQSIVGILLAGIFYSLLPFYFLLILIGICYIFSGISEIFIKYEFKKPETKLTVKSVFGDLKDAFKYLEGEKAMVIFCLSILLLNFFISPFFDNFLTYFVATDITNYSNYLFNEFLTPELWSSVISVAMSIGGIIAGVVLSQKKTFDKIHNFVRIFISGVTLVLTIASVSYVIFVNKTSNLNIYLIILTVISFLTGVLITGVNIPISSMFATRCRKDMLGKLFALLNVGTQGLVPIGVFLAGIVINSFGIPCLLIIDCLGMLFCSLFMIFSKTINEL